MAEKLNQKIAIGYFWNLVAKWINRTIGVVSTLILVRILQPVDFGIAALATIVLALFMMLSEVGTDKYVIKAKECTTELLNSAWSLNIFLKLICALILALMSGVVADFTNEPVLRNVLLVSSLIPIIGSFKNIGLALYERELNYKPLTRLTVWVKIAVFPVTITLAFWLQNYWALIVGLLTSEILTVAGSYRIHSFRPQWTVTQWREQWGFSQWMVISTTTGYIRSRIDALLLGRYLPSEAVGTYRVSQEFAWLPFTELIAPATSSFYSGISKISDDKDELRNKVAQYLTVTYLLVIPSAIGIYALQEQIVIVVLGEKWQAAIPILGLLSLLMLSMPLNIALQTVLVNLSKVKYMVALDGVMITLIIGGFYFLHQNQVSELLVYTEFRVLLVLVFISLLMVIYKRVLGLGFIRLCLTCFVPLIPGVIMYWCIKQAEGMLDVPVYVSLMLLILLGVFVFVPLIIVATIACKRVSPDYENIYSLMIYVSTKIQRKMFLRKVSGNAK
ncbi:oligosaccharide flippase family protein [Vibrio hannami]|uniref:oligosaccharide flippase family protein n=1 Tax=Vibrio hannami TaxID=2717094 RepID=UPI002410987D|nr:oligosaccharide flippase family protein [Vibrio hannami]MDG3088289.1 oligosaccharide flippase family protein [Vibrio hannami]